MDDGGRAIPWNVIFSRMKFLRSRSGRMSRLRCNRTYANTRDVAGSLIFKTTFRSCDPDVKNGQRDVTNIRGREAISLEQRIKNILNFSEIKLLPVFRSRVSFLARTDNNIREQPSFRKDFPFE